MWSEKRRAGVAHARTYSTQIHISGHEGLRAELGPRPEMQPERDIQVRGGGGSTVKVIIKVLHEYSTAQYCTTTAASPRLACNETL